jgi:hypothetical protein
MRATTVSIAFVSAALVWWPDEAHAQYRPRPQAPT